MSPMLSRTLVPEPTCNCFLVDTCLDLYGVCLSITSTLMKQLIRNAISNRHTWLAYC